MNLRLLHIYQERPNSHMLTRSHFSLTRYVKLSRLYGVSLLWKKINPIHPLNREYWKGSSSLAQEMLNGSFELCHHTYTPQDLFTALLSPENSPEVLSAYVQSFSFLHDLSSISANVARRFARQLIEQWILSHHSISCQSWLKTSWSLEFIGARLYTWLTTFEFYASTADDDFKELLHKSIAQQLYFLKRHWRENTDSHVLLWNLKALLLAKEMDLLKDLDLTEILQVFFEKMPSQLFEDGGHISQSPSVHWKFLKDLIEIRYSLHQLLSSLEAHSKDTEKRGAKNASGMKSSVASKASSITPSDSLLAPKNAYKLPDTPDQKISLHLQNKSSLKNLNFPHNKIPKEGEAYQKAFLMVQDMIQKMTPILRLLRRVDGSLSKVSGQISQTMLGICGPIASSYIDGVLSLADVQDSTLPKRATSFGIERCANRSSVLLVHTFQKKNLEETFAGASESLNILGAEWSVGKYCLLTMADLMLKQSDNKWLNHLNHKNLKIHIKRSTKENALYLDLSSLYESPDLCFSWQRSFYISPQSDELRGMDTLSVSKECIAGFRFMMHPHSLLTKEGEKFICSIKEAIIKQPKTLSPLTHEPSMLTSKINLEEFYGSKRTKHSITQNPTIVPDLALTSSTNQENWSFRILGADETFITRNPHAQEGESPSFMCLKELSSNKSYTFHWHLSSL